MSIKTDNCGDGTRPRQLSVLIYCAHECVYSRVGGGGLLFDAETDLYGVGDVGDIGAGVEGHHVFKHEGVVAL